MRTIERVTDIEAHPSRVWQILSATDEYDQWNPFITRLDGHFVQGSRLTVTIKPGNRPATFRPTVLAVEEGKLIRWRGRLGVRGIFGRRPRAEPGGTRRRDNQVHSARDLQRNLGAFRSPDAR